MYLFQVPSWKVSHFPPFKTFQEYPSEGERKWLEQKKNNIINYIFGHFDLMLWWEAKVISGFTTYPFEEETHTSKTPLFLSDKISELKNNIEKNIPGCTNGIEKWLQLTMNIRKQKVIMFLVNNLNLYNR